MQILNRYLVNCSVFARCSSRIVLLVCEDILATLRGRPRDLMRISSQPREDILVATHRFANPMLQMRVYYDKNVFMCHKIPFFFFFFLRDFSYLCTYIYVSYARMRVYVHLSNHNKQS